MKKHLTTRRIAMYLLYLVMVGMLVFGVTYARYLSTISGSAKAQTAAVALDSSLDLTSSLAGMQPGESKIIKFAVKNQKGDTTSEVAQEYTITISTTNNLPLTYTLNKQDSNSGSYVTNSSNLTWTGGLLPYSASGVTHTYTLTVAWPPDKAAESYADEIDLVTLTVDAKQVNPATP